MIRPRRRRRTRLRVAWRRRGRQAIERHGWRVEMREYDRDNFGQEVDAKFESEVKEEEGVMLLNRQ